MKELTIEEKAKAYDEAIEKARLVLQEKGNEPDGASILSKLFPELIENEDEVSEDEKMCKVISDIILIDSDEIREILEANDLFMEDIDAWLEKQSRQKSTDTCDSSTINGKEFPASEKRDFGYFSESGDKIESKFHEGEWITNGDYTWKIVEVKPLDYILQSQDGNIVDDTISYIDEQFHSFTIEDAKPGDVLVCKGSVKGSNGIKYKRICLFNNLDKAFFTLTETSNSVEEYAVDVNIDYPDNTVPATKGQKEILFMAMADAGYTFDFEKKELRKIEQKHAWSEEDLAIISRVISIVKWAAYSDHSHPILNDEGATELVKRLKSLKERMKEE